MITTKQRAYLRSLAQNIQATIQLGKDGISENVIKQYEESLEARELIKTNVLKTCEFDAREASEIIASQVDAIVVQVIGHKFVLYKQSEKNKKIDLTKI